PRPTAIASLLRALPTGAPRHPVARTIGWWRRPIRMIHRPAQRPAPMRAHGSALGFEPLETVPPLLICGASGTLGGAFAAGCQRRNIPYELTDRTQLDLRDVQSIGNALDSIMPWAVINAAGWVRVDEAETAKDACFAVNTTGALN